MNVLYISYDGLTDNLGGSQILPYVIGLARKGHSITILSSEKPERFSEHGNSLTLRLAAAGIRWVPCTYHKSPPIFSSIFDLWRLRKAAARLHRERPFEAVHCRSYLPALVGLWLRRAKGVSFIFDMRGFWADERVDGGLWKQNHLAYRLVFRFFKRKERQLLNEADVVISLTEAAERELLTWQIEEQKSLPQRMRVIPCCADLEHFQPRLGNARREVRAALGIEGNSLVPVYLGSIGTWYLLDDMMRFFALLLKERPDARFLFISTDNPEIIFRAASRAGVAEASVIVISATREKVPGLLAAADFGLFFIRASYSKISSSATKLGELLAMGLPVVANEGVGDQKRIFDSHPIGHILPSISEENLERAVADVPRILGLSPLAIREAAEKEFSLSKGVDQYASVYAAIETSRQAGENKWHQ